MQHFSFMMTMQYRTDELEIDLINYLKSSVYLSLILSDTSVH
jgi:hypothetical protein